MTGQIILSMASVAASVAGAATPEQIEHAYGHRPPVPSELGGAFAFSDWKGAAVGEAEFRGYWTLLFFGYSRCTSSCTIALPTMVKATRMLIADGVPARAAFVDIEAPPLQLNRRSTGKSLHADHEGSTHLEQLRAMKQIARKFAPDLLVLTGTRGQLSRASIAFRVNREHIPPRPGEVGHSMNHSSMIYFVGPTTAVAGYGYHDTPPRALAEAVRTLSKLV